MAESGPEGPSSNITQSYRVNIVGYMKTTSVVKVFDIRVQMSAWFLLLPGGDIRRQLRAGLDRFLSIKTTGVPQKAQLFLFI